jgi:hypothetical protein
MSINSKNFLVVLILVIVSMATRFIFLLNGESILPNFSAIGAIAIFGACYFKGFQRFLIPLLVLWGSDIILNNMVYAQYYDSYQAYGDLWVYFAFLICGFVGYFMMQKGTWGRLLSTSLLTGLIFYIVTNFGVWASGLLYPKTSTGLVECFTAAIPFFRNTLLGNVFYTFVLFGVYEFVLSRTFTLNRLIVAQ